MSEETPAGTPEQPGQQQTQVFFDDRDQKTVYVNGFMFQQSGGDEVVVDVGHNVLRQNPQGGPPQVVFRMTDRMIMSYGTAKKLANSFTQLVKRYEQQFGEISTNPRR